MTDRGAAQRVVISYSGVDRSWAVWAQAWLERAGVEASVLRFDPTGRDGLAAAVDDLLGSDALVLLLVSPSLFRRSDTSPDEWNEVLRALSAERRSRLRGLVLSEIGLPAAVALLRTQSVVDIPEGAALRRLFRLLDLSAVPAAPAVPAADARTPRYPGSPASVWGAVPRRNLDFTGRRELLEAMRLALEPGELGSRPVVLTGMPGVGKSAVAAEYAYRHRSSYDVIWWVQADNRRDARAQLASLAEPLGLRVGSEIGDQLRAVQEALRVGEPYRDWLLIFDNADSTEHIAPLIPDGTGQTVITSSNRDWTREATALREVPLFTEAEGVAFLRRRLSRLATDDALAVGAAVGWLPICLEQSAATLADPGQTVADYVRRITEPDGGSDSFQRVMDLRLRRLDDEDPLALQVLRLCACFGPGPVPARLVRPTVAKDLPAGLRETVTDPQRWTEALSELERRSLLRTEYTEPLGAGAGQGTGPGRGFTIELHRMLRHTVIQGMRPHERESMVRAVRQILAAADPGTPDDQHLWARYAEILPHVISSGATRSTNPVIQDLVYNVLRYLYLRGEYRAAGELAEDAYEAWGGRPYPLWWRLRLLRADIIRALADYTASEAENRAAFEELGAERAQHELDYLQAGSSLAADLRALGRYDEALDLQSMVRETRERLLGAPHPDSLRARHNQAVTLRVLGRFDEALAMHQEVFSTARQVMGVTHPHVLLFAMAVAQDLRLIGRYDEALDRQEHCLEWCLEALGPEQPLSLRARHLLGLCQRRAGLIGQAGENLEHASARLVRLLGPDHPDALSARNDLATYLRDRGETETALGILDEVVAGFRKVLGRGHPNSIGAESNRAMVLQSLGRREEAVTVSDSAANRMQPAVGATHPWTVAVMLNASACRNVQGDVDEALRLSEQALSRARERLGDDHPLTLSCEIAVAADLRARADRLRAEKIESHAVRRLEETLGESHVHTRSARLRHRPHWDLEFMGV
ncbi:FxSxx-COOH system tetratricopeptide repeat protein [Streptacidiphilus jiangxiensis]|uniref:Tetratricopeptide repeat-containing protein n=1 Tax=Streptacidiphilus jiangxiensis TaxID=235985 RepID=A0A1H7G2Y9_STRJI|nr:FxSxx-COOH system tetratricopeptide repeat protein [Streptacidiphilus jiangxiensis]SEK32471.1 Tetratricopeptide repeat-containing protein [Streptacidiphilus jiangxiensis]